MNKKLTLICPLILLLFSGCDPEGIDELDTQITDPNGILQVAADQARDALAPLTVLVRTLPIPYAATIASILGAVGWALGIIKSLQKKKTDIDKIEAESSLREIVIGLEDAKKRSNAETGDIDRNEFRKALSESESLTTRLKVAEIRKEISTVA